MTVLWTERTAREATRGESRGEWQAQRVEIDSRRVQKGDLFVAIKGERFDGHAYVAEALAKGAAAAMVSHIPEGVPGPLLLVEDALKGLEGLARYARTRAKAQVAGVTGSVGKTSAKEMLRMALSAHGPVHATGGNYNNHIGTPLNLANMPPDVPFAVFEMGMNHAGEISHLTHLVRPRVAAITAVEAAHLEFFGSLEAIADAKGEIFEGMGAEDTAVLNRDSPAYEVLRKHASACGHIVTFGAHEKADCRLLEYAATPNGCRIRASLHGQPIEYGLKAVGRHWALLSLLTLASTHAMDLDDAKTARALAAFSELEGRGRMQRIAVRGGEAMLIDDSYNASPAAMRAAFAKMEEVAGKGRKLAALGDMLELGAEAPRLHAELAEGLRRHGFSLVFTAGELMRSLEETLPTALRGGHCAKAMELLPLLKRELQPGDMLLVKGSHGSHMYELAKALSEEVHAL